MYTAKKAVSVVSEGLECFGGQGYIEGTGLPGMLRDAQVLPIWEGTSNVLSLDVLRCQTTTGGEALKSFLIQMEFLVEELGGSLTNEDSLRQIKENLISTTKKVQRFAERTDEDTLEFAARDLTNSLAHIYIGGLLAQQAASTGHQADVFTLKKWMISRVLAPVLVNRDVGDYDLNIGDQQKFIYEGYE